MDREGAETYLRLLAEAAMRGSLTPAAGPRAPDESTIMAAGHALTAVGALDPVTAEEILTDFRLATTARQLHHQSGGQGVTAAEWLTQGQAVLRPRQVPGPVPRGRGPPGGPRPRADRLRPGRPVRPGRADGPVPRRGRPRRAVPHVVRADRLGRAVHRGVAGTF